MRTLACTALALALSLAVGVAHAQPAAPAAPAAFKLAGVHAYLYLHKNGTFSTNDLTTGKVALWNTIIGEGDAEAPSVTMLVKVDVTGPTFANQEGKVTVVAKAGKKTLAKQTFNLEEYFDEGGAITLPLLVAGIGCDEVKVTASLSGKGKKGSATATVPFSCGE